MTGRAAGRCAGYEEPGFASAGYGRFGAARGRGRGRGWRREGFASGGFGWRRAVADRPAPVEAPPAWSADASRGPDLSSLQQQAEELKRALGDLQRRIDELRPEPEN